MNKFCRAKEIKVKVFIRVILLLQYNLQSVLTVIKVELQNQVENSSVSYLRIIKVKRKADFTIIRLLVP